MPKKKEDWLTKVTTSATSIFQSDEKISGGTSKTTTSNNAMAGGDSKRNEGSNKSADELLALVRKDVSGMSDDDLDRLVLETKLESSRRRKMPVMSRDAFKRFGAVMALLMLVLLLVFKGEKSAMDNSSSSNNSDVAGGDEVLAKDGEKGVWLGGDQDLEAARKKKVE